MYFSKLLTITILTAVLLSGCSRTNWIEKNFTNDKANIDSVSIIFPQVEFMQKIGNNYEIKNKQSIFVSAMVANVLKESIDEGDLLPKTKVINYDSSFIEQWVPRYFSNSVSNYKNISEPLLVAENGEKKLPVTPELKLLTDKINTKYFILAAGTSFVASDETKQYDFAQVQTFKLFYGNNYAYNYQWYGLQLHILLVETKTMKVLWHNYNSSNSTKYDPSKKDDIKNLCRELLLD